MTTAPWNPEANTWYAMRPIIMPIDLKSFSQRKLPRFSRYESSKQGCLETAGFGQVARIFAGEAIAALNCSGRRFARTLGKAWQASGEPAASSGLRIDA